MAEATVGARRRLLLTVLEAVYLHVQDGKVIVSMKAKAAFEAFLVPIKATAGSLTPGSAGPTGWMK